MKIICACDGLFRLTSQQQGMLSISVEPIPFRSLRRFELGKHTNIDTFKGFERAIVLAFIHPQLIFGGWVLKNIIHYGNRFSQTLLKLKRAQKFILFYCSTKWSGNARLTPVMTFVAGSTVKTCSMIEKYE